MVKAYVFLLVSLFFASNTMAYTPREGNVNVLVGPIFNKTAFGGSSSGATAPVFAGLGLMGLGDLSSAGALEIGVFYMPKLFVREQNWLHFSEVSSLVQVNLGYRWWIGSAFSASFSFASFYTTGDIYIDHNDFPLGSIPPETAAHNIVGHGFDVAIGWEIWSDDMLGVLLDARYSYSITKREDEKADHYACLLGFRYLVQSKTSTAGSF
jgi:hypothetical protein